MIIINKIIKWLTGPSKKTPPQTHTDTLNQVMFARLDDQQSKKPDAVWNVRQLSPESFLTLTPLEITERLDSDPFKTGNFDFGVSVIHWRSDESEIVCWFQDAKCTSCTFHYQGNAITQADGSAQRSA
ncbi:hypothetical protein [Citrobacter rodentium]|uniref:Uncharacterized protein n=2 Tax=Citrobacter rodentium TaxID=67825 RepID=D2TS04_CITRI|nr:hypothetical protein [Citrobacter rodentium]KIQ50580.1 hypothetical protein TA05_14895 [Citrobacter rodentium]QBY31117.1 hypothetical protein E2R62_21365 [Citrobacter rodentium]UHO31514.1 hypothetical protein K7R23_01865 [Citrobacter rodentium NBRC 105723 = DSM 16636]CBG91603.1 hypothetical protein ROD_49211 [Citrobacter rodentium ICC168]HAT8012386.1 hypothetical protein [Citrobacter rodentium NBRC 105723 = DSM 16636]